MNLKREHFSSCEDELLICCSRVNLLPKHKQELDAILRKPIDWQVVLDKSWWHRVRPLMNRHLSQLDAGLVPQAVLEAFAIQANELEQRSCRLMEQLRNVCTLLSQAELPVITFKGPTLAMDAFGALGLRECGDLDLLIRPQDFRRVRKLLIDHGFACLWDQLETKHKRQLFACEFRSSAVELDIHWDLAPPWLNFKVDFEHLWERGEPVFEELPLARKLQPEDSLEILSMHGSRHWWDRLRWICDLAELVNSDRITAWHRFYNKDSESHCVRSVWLGLWLASELLDAKLPVDILKAIEKSPAVARMASQVSCWLKEGEAAANNRNLSDRFLFRMRLCDRWQDRLLQIGSYLRNRPSRSLNWNS
ncbi:MAG: nucleotidyltransferase family protein [Planctomycetales bacterium]|nr:nucleotidyltransferase family protein [Planctomycetales bacterium]